MEYNPLSTAKQIYQAVLDGIKKESTAVLMPDAFNRLINDAALILWLKDKAGDNDKDQVAIDALRNLYRSSDLELIADNTFILPADYFRLQSVAFRLNDKTDNGVRANIWITGKRLRFDNINMISNNPYRKSNDEKIYYYQQENKIIVYSQDKYAIEARIFYLAYPSPIIYDPAGNSSNGNLTLEQNKEVVDTAVRIFLERVKEERYQTVLHEENLNFQKNNN